MQLTEHWIEGHRGVRLLVRRYQTETPSERTVVIVHGMSEHGGRYEHVVRTLCDAGWNVIIGDLRGHGRSEGVATHVQRFNQYVDDVMMMCDRFQLSPDRTAVMGHSMGALITIRLFQHHAARASVAVLLSHLLGVAVSIDRWTLTCGRVLSSVAPRFRFQSRVDPKYTTRNMQALEERAVDPLIQRSVTARWYFTMQAALKSAWRQADRFDVPVLVMQAGEDRIVDPAAPEKWLQRVGSDDKTLHVLEEHYHELHNEPDWEQTLSTVVSWLDQRIPLEMDVGVEAQPA
jgi:alpha-beta hydrolase superfamily lysophospholipase